MRYDELFKCLQNLRADLVRWNADRHIWEVKYKNVLLGAGSNLIDTMERAFADYLSSDYICSESDGEPEYDLPDKQIPVLLVSFLEKKIFRAVWYDYLRGLWCIGDYDCGISVSSDTNIKKAIGRLLGL